MNKKIIKLQIVFVVMFLFGINFADASVVINEVQLSPTENRFIELYNNGSSSVDLTDWYIQRKTIGGSTFGSLVSKTYFQGKNIQSNSYFVISRSDMNESDIIYPGLTLTESNTIQLKNSNQELVDKIGWGDVTDCGKICAPNPIDSKSIQLVEGSWVTNTPTPGESNLTESNTSDQDIEENENNNEKDQPEILKISSKIISPKIAIAGIPFYLNSLTTSNRGNTYAVGKFVWNFGNGISRTLNTSEPFLSSYEYEGEYMATLSYFSSVFSKVPDATDKIIIKVVPSEIYINSVGDISDPFIEIGNKSNYDIVLSNWVIMAGIHYFLIPDGTVIMSGKKIKLSPKVTGFTKEDLSFITITNPNKEIIVTYPQLNKKLIYNTNSVSKNTNNNSISSITKNDFDPILADSKIINLNDLSANALDSSKNIPKSAYPLIGLLVIIGIGITSFFIVKQKTNTNEINYKESGIRAEDMTIVE